MMLSWHEGFGLTAWEAIAAQVPLIIGKNTGVWKLLIDVFESDERAATYVKMVDVKGSLGSDDEDNFTPQDAEDVRDAILQISSDLPKAQKNARDLKLELIKKYKCTWEATAAEFIRGLDLSFDHEDTNISLARPPERERVLDSKIYQSSNFCIPSINWSSNNNIQMLDSLMLRPEAGVVRFHTFRDALKNEVIDWVLSEPEIPIRMQLRAGEGGAGKTRLMIEVCKECAELYDWQTGFMHSETDIEAELPILLSRMRPTLIVIDYAETRASQIANVVETALKVNNKLQVRLLLLSRDGRDWWNRLADNSLKSPVAASIMRDVSTKQGPYYLAANELDQSERIIAFKEAQQDFARQKDCEIPDTSLPDLSAKHFAQPIYVHLAAMQSLRNLKGLTRDDLLDAALSHERGYWRQMLEAVGLSETHHLTYLEIAIAAITLVGGCTTLVEARKLIERTPRVCEAPHIEQTKILDILTELYSSNLEISSLQPDVLGESLVDQALTLDSGLLDVVVGPDANRGEAEAALTVLARMARRMPENERWLQAVLERFLPQRIPEVIAVAQETGGPLADLMGRAVKKAEGSRKRILVKKYREVLPEETDNLSDFLTLLHDSHLEVMKQIKGKRNAKQNRLIVSICTDFAGSLSKQGKKKEAVLPAKLGLRVAESVFGGSKPSDLSLRSNLMSNLATHLADVGQFSEALEKARQSEEIRRKLAEAQPDAYTPGWARSLGNLSTLLSDVGRFSEAHEKARQSEEIQRKLAEAQPDVYNSGWAISLGNLSGHLSDVGQFSTALEVARQSEEIGRKLAEAQPDAYTPDWAKSLGNLAISLADVGQFSEALEKARQSEEIRRKLAEAQPDAYTPGWARSLGNLSASLADVGQFSEALEKVRQSEEIRRKLAEAQPEAHNSDWASSLGNLSASLADVGRFSEALEKVRQSEEIWRKLAESQPEAHNSDWARSLGNLANVQVLMAGYDPALVKNIAGKAFELLSNVSDDELRANKKWRAFTLRSLAEAHLSQSDGPGALDAARKSIQLWTEVQADSPGIEVVNILHTTQTCFRAEIAHGTTDAAKDVLEAWIENFAKFAKNSGALSKKALRDLATQVSDALGPEALNLFPTDVAEYGEFETLTFIS